MDYQKARDDLATASGVRDPQDRDKQFRVISITTSIDIAESLRIIAGALLPPDDEDRDLHPQYPDEETAEDAERNRPIEVGDRIVLADEFDDIDDEDTWIVVATGESEGSQWVEYLPNDVVDSGVNGVMQRGWAQLFRRVGVIDAVVAARLGIEAKLTVAIAASDREAADRREFEHYTQLQAERRGLTPEEVELSHVPDELDALHAETLTDDDDIDDDFTPPPAAKPDAFAAAKKPKGKKK